MLRKKGGRSSKNKGYRAEIEVVKWLNASGIEAERVPLSGADKNNRGDVLIKKVLRAEVKWRAKLPKIIREGLKEHNLAFIKEDYKGLVVVVAPDFFIDIFKGYLKSKEEEL